jgi:hypothetical protein
MKIEKHPIIDIVDIRDLKIKSNNTPELFIEDINVCKLSPECIVYQSYNLCGLYFNPPLPHESFVW